MTTVGTGVPQVDVQVYAHAPVDFTVAVLDELGVAVDSLAGWTVAAKAAPTGQAKVPLTVSIDGVGVRVTATPEQTAAWYDAWPVHSAPWDVVLTDPNGNPLPPLCAGRWRIYPTSTR